MTITLTQATFSAALSPREPESLDDLVTRYSGWQDPLSKKIRNWSKSQTRDLSVLFKEILIDPLGGGPLREPLLEREWVWEKEKLLDYLKLTNLSPFDSQPMGEARPHEFANGVLTWIRGRGLKRDALALERERSLAKAAPEDSSSGQLKLFIYLQRAKESKSAEEIARVNESMDESTKSLNDLLQQSKLLIAEEREKLERELERHDEELEERIGSIETAHRAEADLMEYRIKQGLRRLKSAEENLQIEKERSVKLRGEVSSLRSSLRQTQREVESLKGESGGSDCLIS